MANIQPTVDALDQPTVMLQIRKIAGTVDSNLESVNDEMTNIQEQIGQMEDVSGRVTTLENEMDTIQSDLTAVENKNTEQDSAISDNANGLITDSELTYAEGVLTLKLTKQNGNLTETVDVPFFKTVTLIPTATDRAFKLQFTMWDDSVYDTNEFVIPAGGGTEVSVTGVTIGEGASDNSFKVSIQLSDASTIASNDYPFPTQTVSPYPTSATLSLSGNTLNLTIGLSNSTNVAGSVDLSPVLANYATQAWVTGQLANYATNEDVEEIQVQITGLTITSNGNTMSINGTSANIVNSVSGTVVDGKLKISVNGVESGDIPFDKGLNLDDAIITGTLHDSDVEIYLDLNISIAIYPNITFTEKTDIYELYAVTTNTNARKVYVISEYGDRLVKINSIAYDNIVTAQLDELTNMYIIPNDISFNIDTSRNSNINLSDGEYRGKIFGFAVNGEVAVNANHIVINPDNISEATTIDFTVNNNVASYKQQTIVIKSGIYYSTIVTINSISGFFIPYDCIEKIN